MSKDTVDKWTLEELDLNKKIVSLYSLLEDKQLLVEKLFSILSSHEIKQMTPRALKVRITVFIPFQKVITLEKIESEHLDPSLLIDS